MPEESFWQLENSLLEARIDCVYKNTLSRAVKRQNLSRIEDVDGFSINLQ